MKNYREIEGDLIKLHKEGKFDFIGHGCNCQKTMGAGIALQIKKEFPDAYFEDKFNKLNPYDRLGNYTYSNLDKVINFYTQFMPGSDAEYLWVRSCFRKLNDHFGDSFNTPKLGLPQIGCGIGGLEWDKVKKIIQEELTNIDVTVVIYKP